MASASPTSGRERRVDERHGLLLDATVRAYRLPPRAASLLDVSAGGAMLKSNTHDLYAGDEIVLNAGLVEIVATIAWRNESFFGLSFHRRLEARELAGLRATGHA
jgi:hypothetical protein